MIWFNIIILVLAGTVSGFFSSLFGWGGGLTIVPALLLYFPMIGANLAMSVHLAVGTCFLVMLITNLVNTYKSHQSGHMLWDIFLLLLPLTIFGTIAGGFVEKIIPAKITILVLTLITVYAFIRFIQKLISHKNLSHASTEIKINKNKYTIFSFFIGLLSSCTGGGSSLMLSPVLKNSNLTMKQTIAVITAMNMLLAVMGIIIFVIIGLHTANLPAYSVGYINILAATILILGSFIGVLIGHKIVQYLNEFQYIAIYIIALLGILILLIIRLI